MAKMAKIVQKTNMVVLAILAALGAYYFLAYRVLMEWERPKMGYEQLDAVTEEGNVRADAAPTAWTGRISVDGIDGKYCHLTFYSIHQIVRVFYGDQCIYKMEPASNNSFAKTPGCVWNDILLDEDMNGGEILVELTPVYENLSYDTPQFLLGEKGGIIMRLLEEELFAVIVSLILVITGIIMIGYVAYNHKNSEVDKNLTFLGIFAVFIGIWKLSDSAMMKMFYYGYPIFSLLPFMALMMMVIPFVVFFMNLQSGKSEKPWYVACWISLSVIFVCLFLQYSRLADFRQVFWMILLSMLVGLVVAAYMVVKELLEHGWNAGLRRNVLGMMVTILGFLIDVCTYFFSGGRETTSFVIFGLLLYTIAMGLSVLRESSALIVAGSGAQSYEDMAYHDKMTGLSNRAAFIVDTDPYEVDPENYVVAVLDLNNLKRCNDTLGHEMGDKYIQDSAEIIKKTFGTIGSCYRMGGDEFYCLIPNGGQAACREQQAAMEHMIEEYNQKSEDVRIAIACGFARYDNRIDYDLNATAKRADQMMYHNKDEMKKQKS